MYWTPGSCRAGSSEVGAAHIAPHRPSAPRRGRESASGDAHLYVSGLLIGRSPPILLASSEAREGSVAFTELDQLEEQGLAPRSRWSRRGFVMTSLATGFALSVQPVSAQTITTDSTGLDAGEVKVKTKDGEIPAYRAMPDKGGPFPTVLVVQEVFGVHEHIKELCRRLAKAGYFAIAPELYVRQGDPSKYTEIPKLIAELVSKVPDEQVMSDLDAAVAYAKGSGKADTAKLAITGFCYGGRITWLYAAHNPGLKAGFAWYGAIERPRTENNPKHP